MIRLTTIEGLVKYAKGLIDNLKGRQIVPAKTAKIYRIDGGTKTLNVPAESIGSFVISFRPDSGKRSHAELLLDIDIDKINTIFFESFGAQLTPLQPINGTDWLVYYRNKDNATITKNIGVAVNSLENGTVILQ